MLNVSNTVRRDQTVMIVRPAKRKPPYCPYSALLKKQGAQLIEDPNIEVASKAMEMGCRVGLLMLDDAESVAHLHEYEPLLSCNKISWIGMIAPELVSDLRVRECISTYLFNFLLLPAHPDHTMLMLRHAWGMALMRESCASPENQVEGTNSELMTVGRSEEMQHLHTQIRKVARSDASVLITGPSGTGKELAARSVHRQSQRANAPFVAVNCGAIVPQLLQSELFGYEKGAFTGAMQRRIGHIESAKGGTLFLDEIGDMPLDMQVNLLRFLQEKSIVRVGGTDTLPVDVRVIAATHVDLAEAVVQGRFREDLYYRINVVSIKVPKLAERVSDIEELANHYFRKFSLLHNRNVRGFSRSAVDAMLNYAWPGNVRELVNRVQRAVIMAEGRYIQAQDLGLSEAACRDRVLSLEEARASTDRLMIQQALSQTRNQISQAANLLGVSRVTLYRLLEKYNIPLHNLPPPVAPFLDRAK